ncbi:hypothetical protein [bacterium endosymbiont of Bathymodiolus sp. 5 South]|uniref:hypothetical protein n=1 Tax=bacterium endosymbiont of Bathymodiolus sp. 5 South TaxID=1181670 RepID=UPI0011186ADE|nr:hypothetical protein [bacterium endosymbiont of Bathymodiolus sp. 5 South]
MISLNLVLAGLRLGLKNRQVGEKWVSDDCFYLCKGLLILLVDWIMKKALMNLMAKKKLFLNPYFLG